MGGRTRRTGRSGSHSWRASLTSGWRGSKGRCDYGCLRSLCGQRAEWLRSHDAVTLGVSSPCRSRSDATGYVNGVVSGLVRCGSHDILWPAPLDARLSTLSTIHVRPVAIPVVAPFYSMSYGESYCGLAGGGGRGCVTGSCTGYSKL